MDEEKLSEEDKKLIEDAIHMAKDLLWEQTAADVKAKLVGKAVANIEWMKQNGH
jgi:hypothetical protein